MNPPPPLPKSASVAVLFIIGTTVNTCNTKFIPTCKISICIKKDINLEGWRMVKSENRRDAEILVKNPSPRLLGKKSRDPKK